MGMISVWYLILLSLVWNHPLKKVDVDETAILEYK